MRPVAWKGQGGRFAALVAALVVVLAVFWDGPAGADPAIRQFTATPSSISWQATAAGGKQMSCPVSVDQAEEGPGDDLDGFQPSTSQNYLEISVDPSCSQYAGTSVPVIMPRVAANLVTPEGTVAGILPPAGTVSDDGTWYFPVAADLTSATLEIAPFTKALANIDAVYTDWNFSPPPIQFSAPPPATPTTTTSVPTPTSVPTRIPASPSSERSAQISVSASERVTVTTSAPQGGKRPAKLPAPRASHPTLPVRTRARPRSPRHDSRKAIKASPVLFAAKGANTSLAVPLGIGVGGACLVGACVAGLVSFTRRRAFYRADREGRIVLSGPPPLVAGAAGVVGEVLPRDRPSVLVKLLGWLEIEGSKRPVTSGPLLEIIVFLVLNPGRSFTSVQLRESIWGLGRRPITSASFRTYMVEFRKAFGTGVVVTDRKRYEMTGNVTSDWDQFRAFRHANDLASGREEALGLVRGPVLYGCFDGKKNSPFSWAVGTANDIEDEVTSTAIDFASCCLDDGDPDRAAKAVSMGLRCSDSNLRLRMVDLRVGAALGGPNEIGRRLAAGRAAMAGFPGDVADLETEARALGWASVAPG